MGSRIAVLDVGKTSLKLSVCEADGRVIETMAVPNVARPGPPWGHHDLKGLGDWVLSGLADLSRRHEIGHFVPTGHGTGGVLVVDDPDAGGDGTALPMIDYEQPMPEAVDAAYQPLAGSFHDRGSAVMMASTHSARQMLRMEMEAPRAFGRARWFLGVAQYWAWRLSGVAVSEATAMGAQSHLWNVPQRRFAPIVAARGWGGLLPGFAPAWSVLGPLRGALCDRYGIRGRIAVHAGVHDSSASFYRYLAAGLREFSVASTGTWIVALSDHADLARLDERMGTTINADVTGRAVGGALTMGGRAFSAIAGEGWRAASADGAAIAGLVARGTMALPAFGSDHGQFPGSSGRGRIVGPPPEGPDARRSLAVLHAALLTRACLASLGPSRHVVLDGSFTEEPLFAPLVAALLPGVRVDLSAEKAGVTAGAALLAGHAERTAPVPLTLYPVDPFRAPGLTDYAARWEAAAKGQIR
ncbi:MAG: hypothetical protein RLZZ528_397 [Pseudomonadota bacterium]